MYWYSHRNTLFPHYLLSHIEEVPKPPQLHALPLCLRALAETGYPAGRAPGLTCWSLLQSQVAAIPDMGLITALSCPCTFSIWHLNLKGVMAITHSVKEAWRVRNWNALVWNAIYYFQIRRRRCSVCVACERHRRDGASSEGSHVTFLKISTKSHIKVDSIQKCLVCF